MGYLVDNVTYVSRNALKGKWHWESLLYSCLPKLYVISQRNAHRCSENASWRWEPWLYFDIPKRYLSRKELRIVEAENASGIGNLFIFVFPSAMCLVVIVKK